MQLIRMSNSYTTRVANATHSHSQRVSTLGGGANNAKAGRPALIWIKAGGLEAGAELD